TIGTHQAQGHAGNPGFALVLDAVAVGIDPDVVAHRDLLQVDTGVPGGVDALGGGEFGLVVVLVRGQSLVGVVQGEHLGQARGGVGVRVGRIVRTGIGLGEPILLGLFLGEGEAHLVVAGEEVVEEVVALLVGGGRGHHVTGLVEQLHGYVKQDVLIGVLHAVPIRVDPGVVTHRIGFDQSVPIIGIGHLDLRVDAHTSDGHGVAVVLT